MKVDIFPGAVGSRQNILVIPNSHPNEKKRTYRAVAVIRKPSVEGVYVQSLVNFLFMMQHYDFIHWYYDFPLDHINDIWLEAAE